MRTIFRRAVVIVAIFLMQARLVIGARLILKRISVLLIWLRPFPHGSHKSLSNNWTNDPTGAFGHPQVLNLLPPIPTHLALNSGVGLTSAQKNTLRSSYI